jgi:hypothetical protein
LDDSAVEVRRPFGDQERKLLAYVDACEELCHDWVALALGNIDHSRAIVPETKGTAALLPLNVAWPPDAARLVISCPGALRPLRPIEAPRLDSGSTMPWPSQATTGITHGWRVMAELSKAIALQNLE